MLKGLDQAVLARVADRINITEGAELLIGTLKSLGYKTAILSGGFSYFGRLLQDRLGIDHVYANELEIERVLTRMAGDPELRQAWVRYNVVRTVAAGQTPTHLELDISSGVRAALDAENRGTAALKQRFMRPLASMAVAASVAATVVFGGQQLAQGEA